MLHEKNNVIIDCQKINYTIKGTAIVKITINDNNNVQEYYAITPSNRSHTNDLNLFEDTLFPIIKKYHNEMPEKEINLNFSQGFPLLSTLKFNPKSIDFKKDNNKKLALDNINKVSEFFEKNNVMLGRQIPIKDPKEFKENYEFSTFRNEEKNISDLKFNDILYSRDYKMPSKKVAPRPYAIVQVVQHVTSECDQNYFISYLNAKGDKSEQKFIKFKSELDKEKFFNDFFERLSKEKERTLFFTNELELKNEKFNKVQVKKITKPLENIIHILQDENQFNFVSENADIKTINPKQINYHINQNTPNRLDILRSFNSDVSVQNDNFFEKRASAEKNISHILLKRSVDENHESIYAVIIEKNKNDKGQMVNKYQKIVVDVKSDSDTENLFTKFNNVFEHKVGYPLNEVKADLAQVHMDGFNDRKDFVWMLKEQVDSLNISLAMDDGTPYKNIIDNYVENNEEYIQQKKRVMADDGPTDENTLCVYTDASIVDRFRNNITYGAVIRKPNSDKIICRIKGSKKFEHKSDTNAAEEIAIIETLGQIDKMMKNGELNPDLKIEIRADNIYTIDNLNGCNGKDKKVSELFASSKYKKYTVNDLLKKFNNIEFKWIKGHCDDPYNEKTDELAKSVWKLVQEKKVNPHESKIIVNRKALLQELDPKMQNKYKEIYKQKEITLREENKNSNFKRPKFK